MKTLEKPGYWKRLTNKETEKPGPLEKSHATGKRKRIGFVNNLTIKHCDRTKVKTITVKKSEKKLLKTLKSDDVSTFTQRHFQVKMNKKRFFEYKCTKQILRE